MLRRLGDILHLPCQVTKLSNDPTSGAARPTSTAVAKGIAPPASVFDPTAPHPWAQAMLQAVEDEKQKVRRVAGVYMVSTRLWTKL